MSNFSVTRAANGQVVLSMSNLENYRVNNVGTMSGDASFSLGKTSGTSNQTVLQVGQTDKGSKLEFKAADTADNFQIYGQNIDADFNTKNATAYNVEWDASNSKFDSSDSDTAVLFEAGKNSRNNYIKLGTTADESLGKYDNVVVDNGTDNLYVGSDKSVNRYETTSTSKGAIIKAGNGANDFYIGGSDAVVKGGSGSDTFITDQATANRNILLGGDGDDTILDYGRNTLFIGGKGTDSAGVYGKNGILNMGFDEASRVSIGNGSDGSAVFTGKTATTADGTTYNYNDILKDRGWTRSNFLEESGVSANPYYSLIKSDIEETLG